MTMSGLISPEELQKKLLGEANRGLKLDATEIRQLQSGNTIYYRKRDEERIYYGKVAYVAYGSDGSVEKIMLPPYKKGTRPIELWLYEIDEIYKRTDHGASIEIGRLQCSLEAVIERNKQIEEKLRAQQNYIVELGKKYN